jgi:hypothetical protein
MPYGFLYFNFRMLKMVIYSIILKDHENIIFLLKDHQKKHLLNTKLKIQFTH